MRLFILLIFLLFFYACKKKVETLDYETKTIQYKSINNIDDNLLSLDLYFKEKTGNKPVVIHVHGGGWAIGDKAQNLNNKISFFNTLDYVFVSINYRLSPYPYKPNDANRIKYPDHSNDVADAILWVYDNIEKYGGNKNKIALMGHSAGAQLVALAGINKSFLESRGLSLSIIKGVAIIDTQGFDILDIRTNSSISNRQMYENAFGNDINENNEASAIKNIESGIFYPKMFVAFRGSNDRKTNIQTFINILENNNVAVTSYDGSQYTHAAINDAIGKENETSISSPLKDFFKECFN